MTPPKQHPQRESIPTGRWFPVARRIRHWCCRCGAKHTFSFRTKGKNVEMRVEP